METIETALRISYLINAHLRGTISDIEEQELQKWLTSKADNRAHFDSTYQQDILQQKMQDYQHVDKASVWRKTSDKIQNELEQQPKNKNLRQLFQKITTAAAAVLLLSLGTYYILLRQPDTQQQNEIAQTEIADLPAGTNRAILTLENGQSIDLSEQETGIVMNGESITYKDGSPILSRPEESQTLTLHTPKGGRYELTLSDGTKVWLNAASTLRYPARFNGQERRVQLDGEAYFEVAHQSNSTFKVASSVQEVSVLGTHFNVKAYTDEPLITTTLLEGSVRVINTAAQASSALLKPGQQSTLSSSGQLKVSTASTEDAIAWKENIFVFHHTGLQTILLELSRWYNFNIDIHTIPNNELYGEIPKDLPLSEVLKVLSDISGYRFKLIKDETTKEERRLLLINN
ncbi:FecR family protein [Sphingobacterium tabacisoli]|uniref:FecR family protein n=1 Tax=Sphingobacterium tabacisoli TaxID=2044855 RepID=A0ABW5L6A7_9SPHI|nr:FecR family protein [Sphingobacterium tabacisoli]